MRVQAKQKQICRKCGNQFVFRDKKVKRIDADTELEWAERNFDLCPECYKAEATRLAIKRADGYGLPRLSGVSSKQTALAIMLRDRYITANIDLFQYFHKAIASFGVSNVLSRAKGDATLETMCSVFTESHGSAIISALQ